MVILTGKYIHPKLLFYTNLVIVLGSYRRRSLAFAVLMTNRILNMVFYGNISTHDTNLIRLGYPYHSPEVYFDYFRRNNITTIIRLNRKVYDAKRFTDAGFQHHGKK